MGVASQVFCIIPNTPGQQHSYVYAFHTKKQAIALWILNEIYQRIPLCVYQQHFLQDAHLKPQLQLSGNSNPPARPPPPTMAAQAGGSGDGAQMQQRQQLQALPEDHETDEFIDIKVCTLLKH